MLLKLLDVSCKANLAEGQDHFDFDGDKSSLPSLSLYPCLKLLNYANTNFKNTRCLMLYPVWLDNENP